MRGGLGHRVLRDSDEGIALTRRQSGCNPTVTLPAAALNLAQPPVELVPIGEIWVTSSNVLIPHGRNLDPK